METNKSRLNIRGAIFTPELGSGRVYRPVRLTSALNFYRDGVPNPHKSESAKFQ